MKNLKKLSRKEMKVFNGSRAASGCAASCAGGIIVSVGCSGGCTSTDGVGASCNDGSDSQSCPKQYTLA